MPRQTRTRPPGAPCWQRDKGWFVEITEVIPELMRYFSVDTELKVYLLAYARHYKCPCAGLLKVRTQIRKDIDAFYNGGHFPDYVFDAYIGRYPVPNTGA